MKLTQIALTGAKRTSQVEVEADIFGSINPDLLSQVVYIYRSNQRQGGAKAKTRGEVNLTKTKWYRQKGTGRARHGARSANLFVGGGVSHGPTGQENWKKNLSVKMKRAALKSSLGMAVDNQMVILATGLAGFTGKTKEASEVVNRLDLTAKQKALIVVAGDYQNLQRSAKNIANLNLSRADRLNAFEVLAADQIVITNEALPVLEQRLSTANKTQPTQTSANSKKTNKTVTKKPDVKKSSVKKVAAKKPAAKKPTAKEQK